eukprot:TRINITY_DN11969_c0_g3_i1.p2 TRINITY_DN11969_c0_g3~~TRINITY_DN11969_c0_g3_i1.p2  ORF type:complete len:425 (+),score=40.72 TRINITY_DN11969_c0_g3_i1:1644-2918(+)
MAVKEIYCRISAMDSSLTESEIAQIFDRMKSILSFPDEYIDRIELEVHPEHDRLSLSQMLTNSDQLGRLLDLIERCEVGELIIESQTSGLRAIEYIANATVVHLLAEIWRTDDLVTECHLEGNFGQSEHPVISEILRCHLSHVYLDVGDSTLPGGLLNSVKGCRYRMTLRLHQWNRPSAEALMHLHQRATIILGADLQTADATKLFADLEAHGVRDLNVCVKSSNDQDPITIPPMHIARMTTERPVRLVLGARIDKLHIDKPVSVVAKHGNSIGRLYESHYFQSLSSILDGLQVPCSTILNLSPMPKDEDQHPVLTNLRVCTLFDMRTTEAAQRMLKVCPNLSYIRVGGDQRVQRYLHYKTAHRRGLELDQVPSLAAIVPQRVRAIFACHLGWLLGVEDGLPPTVSRTLLLAVATALGWPGEEE